MKKIVSLLLLITILQAHAQTELDTTNTNTSLETDNMVIENQVMEKQDPQDLELSENLETSEEKAILDEQELESTCIQDTQEEKTEIFQQNIQGLQDDDKLKEIQASKKSLKKMKRKEQKKRRQTPRKSKNADVGKEVKNFAVDTTREAASAGVKAFSIAGAAVFGIYLAVKVICWF